MSKADYQQVVANVAITGKQTADVLVLLSKASVTTLGAPTRPTSATQATYQPAKCAPALAPGSHFYIIFVNRANEERIAPDVRTVDLDGRKRIRLSSNAFPPD